MTTADAEWQARHALFSNWFNRRVVRTRTRDQPRPGRPQRGPRPLPAPQGRRRLAAPCFSRSPSPRAPCQPSVRSHRRDAVDRGVDPFAGDRLVVRHGWISSCSRRSVGGGLLSCRRVPIVFDPGRLAAPHRAVTRHGFPRFPSSAEWTNVPLGVRFCSGSSCGSRAAFVVLVPVVEVWTLDAVRAVRGPGWVV